MLDDTLRKLLRVIVQFRYHFKQIPTLPELRQLSGRRPADVIKGFKILAAENYITWEVSKPIETAVIIEGWERNAPLDISPQRDVQSSRRNTNIDYWLYH